MVNNADDNPNHTNHYRKESSAFNSENYDICLHLIQEDMQTIRPLIEESRQDLIEIVKFGKEALIGEASGELFNGSFEIPSYDDIDGVIGISKLERSTSIPIKRVYESSTSSLILKGYGYRQGQGHEVPYDDYITKHNPKTISLLDDEESSCDSSSSSSSIEYSVHSSSSKRWNRLKKVFSRNPKTTSIIDDSEDGSSFGSSSSSVEYSVRSSSSKKRRSPFKRMFSRRRLRKQ